MPIAVSITLMTSRTSLGLQRAVRLRRKCREPLQRAYVAQASSHSDLERSCAPTLNNSSINERVKACDYAVRGRVLDASVKIQARLAQGHKYPFNDVIGLNIGNPQVRCELQ